MKRNWILGVLVLFLACSSLWAEDYVDCIGNNSETFSLDNLLGIVAANNSPVYENITHDFFENPKFTLQKGTEVSILGISKDSWEGYTGKYYHRYWVKDKTTGRSGWISGSNMIIASYTSEMVPFYAGNGYFLIVKSGSKYKALVTGSGGGYSGYYNGGARYLELGESSSSPFELERKTSEGLIHKYYWDEERCTFVGVYINPAKDKNDSRYIEQIDVYGENSYIFKKEKRIRNEAYYAIEKAIETNDIELLKKVLATNYKNDVEDKSNSLMYKALVLNDNVEFYNLMKENGFSDCIWFYGEDDMWPESIWPKYQSKKAGKQLNEEESKAVIKG